MKGRKVLLLITLGMATLLAVLFRVFGAQAIWRVWAIPTMPPGFADMRIVLKSIDMTRAGSSTDPFGLVGGYPKIWSLLGWIGISEDNIFWVIIGVFLLYWLSLFLFVQNYEALTAVLMCIVIFSPAAMLGYERGNMDLAIFALLSMALAASAYSNFPSLGLILMTAMLKIYPIAGLAYLLKEPRNKFFLWAGAGLGIFILYAISLSSSLKGIIEYIPKGSLFNYGVGVIGFHSYELGFTRLQTNLIVSLSFLVLYLILVAIIYISYKYPEPPVEGSRPFLAAFRVGAAIYLGTFVQGNSFNYRLIFLLFCIPQLVGWMRASKPIRSWAKVGLATLLASSWGAVLLHFLPANLALALDEVFNWALFVVLLYLFLVSLPDWICKEIDRSLRKYDRRKTSVAP
jgi:hypothetical protein